MWVQSERNQLLAQRSRAYAAVHAEHARRQAAEQQRWITEVDGVTAGFGQALAAADDAEGEAA
jgi:hypothetical protein